MKRNSMMSRVWPSAGTPETGICVDRKRKDTLVSKPHGPVAAGERPDPEAVRLFLQAAEEHAIEAFPNEDDASIARVSRAANVATLAHAIAECDQGRAAVRAN
jgi:hypothetical protein